MLVLSIIAFVVIAALVGVKLFNNTMAEISAIMDESSDRIVAAIEKDIEGMSRLDIIKAALK